MARPTASDVVDEMFTRPEDAGVSLAFVAVRGGDVIAERYGRRPGNELEPAADITAETTLLSWCMAKSITHAAVGLLIVDGLIDVDVPAPVPEWAGTEKEGITLVQLLEMRSGLRFNEDYLDGDTSHCIEMLFGGTDPSFGHYAAGLPLDHVPGSVFNYSSGTSNIVARIVGDLVAGGPGGDPVRILPEGWRDHARTPTGHDGESGLDYGRHFWLWPAFPGSFAGRGYEGQFVVVLPDRDLVMVHLGKTGIAHSRGLQMRLARLAELL